MASFCCTQHTPPTYQLRHRRHTCVALHRSGPESPLDCPHCVAKPIHPHAAPTERTGAHAPANAAPCPPHCSLSMLSLPSVRPYRTTNGNCRDYCSSCQPGYPLWFLSNPIELRLRQGLPHLLVLPPCGLKQVRHGHPATVLSREKSRCQSDVFDVAAAQLELVGQT